MEGKNKPSLFDEKGCRKEEREKFWLKVKNQKK